MNRVGNSSTTLFMNRVGNSSTTLFMNRVGNSTQRSLLCFLCQALPLFFLHKTILS
ncbi:hypothetical protein [Leptospira interrogans]|uniref:hypothetical protein n=1 Tax=Leptospira interrogans TaxID=173 RepID=UPI0012F7B5DE|nr:hypothetical protein [Leptospira interrogans]